MQDIDLSTKIILTDFSEGMLSTAQKRLGLHSNVSYEVVDIENIPYENGRFDSVIANMMLYHVPNLNKGLLEVKRVLSSDGIFYCATYGENGIVPFITNMFKDFGVFDNTKKDFTLQNGYNVLKKHFSYVQKLDYEDSLEITDLEDFIDFIYTLKTFRN